MPKLPWPSVSEVKPTTVGLFLLTCLWAIFQWRDPTPPPVLDQILVATFGAWFASEALDSKNRNSPPRTIKVDHDGNVVVSEHPQPADDDADDNTPKAGG